MMAAQVVASQMSTAVSLKSFAFNSLFSFLHKNNKICNVFGHDIHINDRPVDCSKLCSHQHLAVIQLHCVFPEGGGKMHPCYG